MKKLLVTGTLTALAFASALPALAETDTSASASAETTTSASASRASTSASASAGASVKANIKLRQDAIKDIRTNAKKEVKEIKTGIKETRKANASAKANVTVDGACVGAAVEKRETAIIEALSAYNVSLIASFTARKDALKAAWALTVTADREAATKATHSAHATSVKKAKETFRTSRQNAWKTFKTEVKACRGVTGNVDASAEGADMGL